MITGLWECVSTVSIPLEKCNLFGKTCQVFPEKVTTVSGNCAVDIAAPIMIPACH